MSKIMSKFNPNILIDLTGIDEAEEGELCSEQIAPFRKSENNFNTPSEILAIIAMTGIQKFNFDGSVKAYLYLTFQEICNSNIPDHVEAFRKAMQATDYFNHPLFYRGVEYNKRTQKLRIPLALVLRLKKIEEMNDLTKWTNPSERFVTTCGVTKDLLLTLGFSRIMLSYFKARFELKKNISNFINRRLFIENSCEVHHIILSPLENPYIPSAILEPSIECLRELVLSLKPCIEDKVSWAYTEPKKRVELCFSRVQKMIVYLDELVQPLLFNGMKLKNELNDLKVILDALINSWDQHEIERLVAQERAKAFSIATDKAKNQHSITNLWENVKEKEVLQTQPKMNLESSTFENSNGKDNLVKEVGQIKLSIGLSPYSIAIPKVKSPEKPKDADSYPEATCPSYDINSAKVDKKIEESESFQPIKPLVKDFNHCNAEKSDSEKNNGNSVSNSDQSSDDAAATDESDFNYAPPIIETKEQKKKWKKVKSLRYFSKVKLVDYCTQSDPKSISEKSPKDVDLRLLEVESHRFKYRNVNCSGCKLCDMSHVPLCVGCSICAHCFRRNGLNDICMAQVEEGSFSPITHENSDKKSKAKSPKKSSRGSQFDCKLKKFVEPEGENLKKASKRNMKDPRILKKLRDLGISTNADSEEESKVAENEEKVPYDSEPVEEKKSHLLESRVDRAIYNVFISKGEKNDFHALLALLRSSGLYNYQRLTGETALHAAAYHGSLEATEEILNLGADTELKDSHKNTPLNLARIRGHKDVVKLIKKHVKKLSERAKVEINECTQESSGEKEERKESEMSIDFSKIPLPVITLPPPPLNFNPNLRKMWNANSFNDNRNLFHSNEPTLLNHGSKQSDVLRDVSAPGSFQFSKPVAYHLGPSDKLVSANHFAAEGQRDNKLSTILQANEYSHHANNFSTKRRIISKHGTSKRAHVQHNSAASNHPIVQQNIQRLRSKKGNPYLNHSKHTSGILFPGAASSLRPPPMGTLPMSIPATISAKPTLMPVHRQMSKKYRNKSRFRGVNTR